MISPPGLSSLSNASLADNLPVSKRFLELECTDYLDACKWLHTLPYGPNSRNTDSEVLFDEMCGTCTTKHSVAAELAQELGLPIHKFIVFYRLDGTIRQGADETLSSHRIEYVPTTHCLIGQAGQFVDLTWDNQTGKLKNLTDFEIYKKTEPFLAHKEHRELKSWGVKEYQRTDKNLARLDFPTINKISIEIARNSQPCGC